MGCGSSANTVVNSSQPSINSNIQKPKNQQENKTILHIANKKSPSTSAHSASSDSSNISPCILGGKSTSISFSSIVNPPSTVSPIIAGDISTGSASGVAMASTSKGSIQKSTVTMVTETNEDQKRFNIALKSMCRLVKTDELYSYATQNVISLRLDRIPPNADFSLATLYSKLTNITELDISGNRLGPQGVRTAVLAMIYNDRITTFNISNNQADTDSAECIGKLIALNTTLTWLDVSSNSLGKDFFSRSVGPALQTNTSLKCLKFASCGATDLKVFFECLQKNKTLDILDMSYNYMTNGELTAQMIADILKNQECKLTSLEMKSTGIDVKGMKFLVEGLLSNKSLEIFCVGGNKMSTTGDMAGLVIAAIQHPGLVTFNMDDSRVLDKNDININIKIMKQNHPSKLASLSLVNCSLTDDIIKLFTNQFQSHLSNLISLDLTNNPEITMTTVSLLSQASTTSTNPCSVLNLHIGSNNTESLADVLQNDKIPNLRLLDLRKSKISASMIGRLHSYVLKPSGITTVCLDGLKLSGSKAITELLSTPHECSIKSLSLVGCALNDKDVVPLSDAIDNKLLLSVLRLSTNRITDHSVSKLVNAVLSNENYPLEILDLAMNKITECGVESLIKLISTKSRLHTLLLNGNDINGNGLNTLSQVVSESNVIKTVEMKDQKIASTEDEITIILTTLLCNLGYTSKEDEYGEYESSVSELPRMSKDLSVNLTGLGGLPSSLARVSDSGMIKTDHAKKQPPYLMLNHILQLYAAIQDDKDGIPTLTAEEWKKITGFEKNTSVPSWLQVCSHRDCAIYVSSLSASITDIKLEGILESEADCEVKEVCLIKDPVLLKPVGIAWVLMNDVKSVKKAIEWYHTGQAVLYGQSFSICDVSVKVLDDAASQLEETVRLEIIKRKEEKKAANSEHKALLEASFQASKQRHEYSKAHPAYAYGRVW